MAQHHSAGIETFIPICKQSHKTQTFFAGDYSVSRHVTLNQFKSIKADVLDLEKVAEFTGCTIFGPVYQLREGV